MWVIDLNYKQVNKSCIFMTYTTESVKITIEIKVNSTETAKKFSSNTCNYDTKQYMIKCENMLYISFFGDNEFINNTKLIVNQINSEQIMKIKQRYDINNPWDDDDIYPPDYVCVVPFYLSGAWINSDDDTYYIGLCLKDHEYLIKLFSQLACKFQVLNNNNFIKGYEEITSRM